MPVAQFDLTPFLGLSTTLDSRSIPATSASDLRNVRVETGSLAVRYGTKKLSSGSSFSNQNGDIKGFSYVAGYSSTNAFVDEYLTVERSTVGPNFYYPFTRHAATGAPTQLTNGVSNVTLDGTLDWQAFGFRDTAYLFATDATPSVYKHTIGTATSLSPISIPTAPGLLAYSVTYGATSYSTVNWTGLNVSSNITYTGAATSTNSSVLSASELVIGHSASNVASSVTIDLNGATQGISDWTSNDIFGFQLTTVAASTTFQVTPDSVVLTLINNDGSPISFTPSNITYADHGDVNSLNLGVRFEFVKADRTQWDNVRKIKLEYTTAGTSGTVTLNKMKIKVFIGGVWLVPDADPFNMQFSGSYYSSTSGYEGALGPGTLVRTSELYGAAVLPDLRGLGVQLTLSLAGFAAGANYDSISFYTGSTNAGETTWYRLNTSTSGSWVHKITWPEVLLLDTFLASPIPFVGVTCGTSFKSWVVWGSKGSYQNIRHSKVGNAEVLARDSDELDDETRGATFSLPGDEPVQMHEAADSLIVLGASGVYAQSGDAPTRMTAPQRVPGTRGTAGHWSSAVWRDGGGNAGVAFVDKFGESAWFVSVASSFNGDRAGTYVVQELTANIRGTIRSFLLDGQSISDTSKIRVAIDEATDSLWIVAAGGTRAMVLRRPSPVSGQREWELHDYTVKTDKSGNAATSIAFISGSPRRRLRWVRLTGEVDDIEWDSSANAWITGSNRDSGFAMPSNSIYWTSKTFTGPISRINRVLVERDSYSNTPTITVVSSRQTSSLTLASGRRMARFGPLQKGREHKFTIKMSEADSPIRRVEVEQWGPEGDGAER